MRVEAGPSAGRAGLGGHQLGELATLGRKNIGRLVEKRATRTGTGRRPCRKGGLRCGDRGLGILDAGRRRSARDIARKGIDPFERLARNGVGQLAADDLFDVQGRILSSRNQIASFEGCATAVNDGITRPLSRPIARTNSQPAHDFAQSDRQSPRFPSRSEAPPPTGMLTNSSRDSRGGSNSRSHEHGTCLKPSNGKIRD